MDYLKYWSFTHRPFLEQSFFHGSAQREAIAGIAYFAASDYQFTRLAGLPRCGMTTLLKHVASMRGLGDCAVEILISDAKELRFASDLPLRLASALRLPIKAPLTDCRRVLRQNLSRGVRNMWLIDRVPPALADHLRAWSNACPEISLLAAGQYSPNTPVANDLLIHLAPLGLEDALQYVKRGIEHAAGDPSIFCDAAVVRLFEVCQGKVADMATVAEQALAAAAASDDSEVSTATINMIAAIENRPRNTAAA